MKEKRKISGLIIICIINFIVFGITLGGNLFIDILGNTWHKTFFDLQLWRLLTCMFVHSGITHILCNTVSLLQMGSIVEGIYGRQNFLFIYIVSGLFASVASCVVNMLLGQNVISVGASGAVCGLLGFIFGSLKGNLKSKLSSFIFAIAPMLIVGISGGNVDNIAHIGGIIGGYLVGRLFVKLGIRSYRD